MSFTLLGYVYFFYPVIIGLSSRIFRKKILKQDIEPNISIIITAFNEEQHIARKIENTLVLDYPKNKIEIIVGSDGSFDRTNEIVRSYENRGVRLLSFQQNRGKTMVQNDCVRDATHDLIIFMDASSLCRADCLRKLVSNFTDPHIGAVAGRIEFVQDMENLTTKSQGIYWKYEQMLKVSESRLGSLVGVDGPLYAIRKSLYVELGQEIISDLITPLLVIRDGSSVVYEPEAVTFEEATKRTGDEFRTRRRIVTRGLYGLSQYPELFNIWKRPLLTWQIMSHKILRWLAGLYFLLMLTCSILLMTEMMYLIMFAGMVSLLSLAYRGLKTGDNPRSIYAIPYYFILVNWAALMGAWDFFRGKKVISWKPVRN